MARSNKPIIWGLFAAGGTVAAFLVPVLIVITIMMGYGHIPETLQYETMRSFVGHWIVKIIVFGVISLCLWHAAHRSRTAVHGLGVRADGLVAVLAYGIAGIGTLLSLYYLVLI